MLMPMTVKEVLALFQQNCSGLEGAVVATHDGLVLGATDSFSGDTPAALAASLWVHLQQDLSLIEASLVNESLLWTDKGIWYLAALDGDKLKSFSFAKIESLRGEMNARFDAMGTRIDHLDQDVAALSRRVLGEPSGE